MADKELREQIAEYLSVEYPCKGRACKGCENCQAEDIMEMVILAGYRKVTEPPVLSDGQQLFTVEITRKEFLKLPMVARRRIISKQALLVCQKLDSEDGYRMME